MRGTIKGNHYISPILFELGDWLLDMGYGKCVETLELQHAHLLVPAARGLQKICSRLQPLGALFTLSHRGKL